MLLICEGEHVRGVTLAPAEQDVAQRAITGDVRDEGISCLTSTGKIGYPRGERPPVLGRGSAASGDHGVSDLNLIFCRLGLIPSCCGVPIRPRHSVVVLILNFSTGDKPPARDSSAYRRPSRDRGL